MSTKYPSSALAQNYIVQTAITRHPPRLPCCPLATTSYWTVAHAYCFPIGHPLQRTGLLLATHISKYSPLSHPHSAGISTFFYAARRRYFIAAIKHVPVGRDFVPLSPSDISSLALALAALTSCYRSPHLLKVGACGLAPHLGACSSRTSIFLILHTVLLFYQSLQRYDARPAHNSLVYTVQHVFPAHRWTERSSR